MLSKKQVFVKDGVLNIQVSIDKLINGLRYSDGEYLISDKEKFEKWLSDNNVCYNELSFDKELALYYVDDLSLLPNDIKQLEQLL